MTAAYELTKRGISVDVYEASDTVGGLARSFRLWNQTVDLGPHRFFSNDKRVNALWLEVAGRDYKMVSRTTRIYYRGRYYHYPLKPVNAFVNLGPFEALRCAFSYAKQMVAPEKDDATFQSWVVSRFGQRLFEIFFKTYSEKLWGISCRQIDSDFAAQRIKKLNLLEAVLNALKLGGSKKHKTLVDEFAFPVSGTGMIYQRMASHVIEKGGRVLLKTPVKRVVMREGRARAIELEDGVQHEYDQIISSMPISLLVSRLDEVPQDIKDRALALKFRNTILIYLNVDAAGLFPDQWLYIHASELKMGRVTNFRNWVPELYGNERTSILALEYWANDDDPIWSESDVNLIALAKDEMRKTGLIGDARIVDGHVQKIRRCYPVYERGYKEILKPVEHYLTGIEGLHVIGRYGSFKYNNQDHSILMGLLVAQNIVEGAKHNLWEINTDYDSYQEESLITESGMVDVTHAP